MSKVFISSTVRGFEEYREAARRAVEMLGHTPVMSERFGARGYSSETACITEVQQSDIYILILGSAYGFVTQEGISVTHSEYRAARESNRSILAFVQDVDMEAAQQQLKSEVEAYQSGVFRQEFSTADQLRDGVIQALTLWERGQHAIPADEFEAMVEEASSQLVEYGNRRPRVTLSFLPQPSLRVDITSLEHGLDELFSRLCSLNLCKMREGYQPEIGATWTGITSGGLQYVEFESGLRLLLTSPDSSRDHMWGDMFVPPEMIRRSMLGLYELVPTSSGFAFIGLHGMSQAFVADVPEGHSISMRMYGDEEYRTTRFFNPMSRGPYEEWADATLNSLERKFGHPPRY